MNYFMHTIEVKERHLGVTVAAGRETEAQTRVTLLPLNVVLPLLYTLKRAITFHCLQRSAGPSKSGT